MKVTRIENGVWPPDTYEIEHNNVTIFVIPVVDGLQVNTQHDYHTTFDLQDEMYQLTFYEFQQR